MNRLKQCVAGVVFIVVSLVSVCSYGFVNDNVPYGTTGKGQVVVRKGYVISVVKGTGVSEWECYTLLGTNLVKNVARSNNFKADDEVISMGDVSHASDYNRSGYDKGHLVPADDMSRDETLEDETFLMSNMSPQLPGFNRGVWKRLENKVREWAVEREYVNVCDGPIYNDITKVKTIGADKVFVPDAFFKIVVDNNYNAIGFVMPNHSSDSDLFSFAVSIRTIEQKTGIDFNDAFNKVQQDRMETKVNVVGWK